MYKWDRDLLHRAVDVQMQARELGRKIAFEFPCVATGSTIDFITKWDYENKLGYMSEIFCSNEELRAALDKLEKELSQDVKDPGTKSSSYETTQPNYKESEGESQERRRTQG